MKHNNALPDWQAYSVLPKAEGGSKMTDMYTPQAIKKIRKSLGLTATEFAAKLGVTENTVRRWEGGQRHPRYAELLRIHKMQLRASRCRETAK